MGMINREALFSDETEGFRQPCEADAGDTVKILFRAEKDGADAVLLIETGITRIKTMTLQRSDELFDYFITEVTVGENPMRYYFQIEKDEDICFYNRLGAVETAERQNAFCITPGFHVPAWAKGAIFYQIFVDRFCNGEPDNDVETGEYVYIGEPVQRAASWDELPGSMDVRRFYGGDLQGVWQKLDYLKSLKVEAIYLNPIFVSPSNHKYDCQDYDHVDPHLAVIKKDKDGLVEPGAKGNDKAGKYIARTTNPENLEASDRFFADFIKAAHDLGIRVIVDGVFNHCGSFNKWLDAELLYQQQGGYPSGAFVSANSRYRDFFKFEDENGWPFNGSYDGWWGHPTLPKLNYEESRELYDYIMGIGKKWVSPPFNADGWRLDVAADLGRTGDFNHQFWRDFRKAVKRANPEAIILAEHYGDPSSWLEGDQWDTVMNYDAFMEPVSWFLTGMEKHSDERNDFLFGNGPAFFDAMMSHMCRLQTPSLMAAMNELSNHDHSRFMTRTNRTVGRLAEKGSEAASWGISYGIFRQGVVIHMTWPGAPTIYYGDETGLCGWTDPDDRRTYPWGHEDHELIEFHRYMTGIRKKNPALRTGSLKMLAADQGMIAYGRFTEENKCLVIVNTGDNGRVVFAPVWQMGVKDSEQMRRHMLTYEAGYNAGILLYPVKEGILEVELPPRGAMVLAAQSE